jgi:hypothetical protein
MNTVQAPINADDTYVNGEADDPSIGLEALFRFQAKIVGKRFYNEILNDGELVYLVREPNNPYDRNAIKVESINHQQVGHISAASSFPNVAACLAPILHYTLDPSQPKTVGALAEAVSVEGSGTKFSSLCIVTLVGLPEHHEKISQHLKNKMLPHLDLKNNKCVLGYVDINSQIQKSTNVIVEHQKMSTQEVIDSMNAIWDEQDKEVAVKHYSTITKSKACSIVHNSTTIISKLSSRSPPTSLQLPPGAYLPQHRTCMKFELTSSSLLMSMITSLTKDVKVLLDKMVQMDPESLTESEKFDLLMNTVRNQLSILTILSTAETINRAIVEGTSQLNVAAKSQTEAVTILKSSAKSDATSIITGKNV